MGNISRWLDVEAATGDIELNTLPSNVALCDLNNDNEYKLILGDFGRGSEGSKLKVFKGAAQISDIVLPGLPLGVVSFYTSETNPRAYPTVAVAFDSCIYVYRDLKLFYKYYLPSAPVTSCETGIWEEILEPINHNPEAIANLSQNLSAIHNQFLTPQSTMFLAMTVDQKLEYLEESPKLPVQKPSEITCISTMKMYSIEAHSVSCLIIGTEDGNIIILDTQNYSTLQQVTLSEMNKTPYQIVPTGLYSVDYRITVATREKSVCLVKRDWKEGRILFNTDEHIISIEVMTTDNSVIVLCTDHTMAWYTKKGSKQWSLTLEHRPVAMTMLPLVHLGATLVGVALASGHLHLYDGKALVDTVFVRDVVSVMKFGQLGQEEHVLIIITASGNLTLKILKRTADFNVHATSVVSVNSGTNSNRPWILPKKSKLFLEQTARERDNAIAMHDAFQKDLTRLRLTAAKTLLDAYNKSDNSLGVGAFEPVRLAAEVEGLGPVFRVTLIVANTSCEKAVIGLSILFHVHNTNYKVYHPYIKVPLLSPGSSVRFPTKVEEVFANDTNPDLYFRTVTGQGGERSLVKILLLKEGRASPILAATVQMPPTDPMMVPYDKIQSQDAF